MTDELSFRTRRLELVAATLEHVLAEISGSEALAALLKVQVPSSWPPGEYDRDALEFFKGRLESAGPEERGWYHWYVISLGTSVAPGSTRYERRRSSRGINGEGGGP